MAQKFLTEITLQALNNATTDTDKFLVSDGGTIKFRTGAEVLSDIGGQVAGNYVPTSRTLTINGVTYDLSADRSWTVSVTETDTLATVTGRGASTSTLSNFNGGLTAAKTSKTAYGVQLKGAFYGAPRLQLYDLAVDGNAFLGLGVDMSTASYEFSNYFPRVGGSGRWSVGSWAGDFGTGQYVSGYNEKLWVNENAAQFNVNLGAPLFYDSNNSAYYLDPSNTSNLYGLTVATTINGNVSTADYASVAGNAYSANYARRIAYPDRLNFTVGGNANTFYPIAIFTGAGATTEQYSEFMIERGGYDDPGYTGIGFSTFNARFVYKPTGWGYNANYFDLEQLTQTTPCLGDYLDQYQSAQAIIWLRGGTTYWIYSIVGTINMLFDNAAGGDYVMPYGTYTPITSPVQKAQYSKYHKGSLLVNDQIASNSYVSAPLFYDLDNTVYYLNPASTSNLNSIDFYALYSNRNNSSGAAINLDNVGSSTWPILFKTYAVGNDNESGFWVGSNGYPDMRLRREDGTVRALISSWERSYTTFGLTDSTDMRAPIFLDSNDTNYYIDPASTSNLLGLTVVNTITGNISGTAGSLLSYQSNWASTPTPDNVVGLLGWKNYGNGHVIFDASASTTPSGTGCSSVNPQNNWTSSFPTLMGWNGANTYGVRVDSARVADSAGSAAWSTITGKPSNIFYYQGFTLDANTMDSNSSGFTYQNNAPFNGPVARFSANGGYDLWLNADYGGGAGFAFRTKNGDTGTFNPWRYPALYGVSVNGGGALYATMYYDQDDTTYYIDAASTSNLNTIQFSTLRSPIGDWVLGYQGGTTYSFGSASVSDTLNVDFNATNFANSCNWFGGYGPGSGAGLAFENLGTFARMAFWGLDFYDWNHGIQMTIDNGYVSANNSFRAPIFYDVDNTVYYTNPAGSSYMNSIIAFQYRFDSTTFNPSAAPRSTTDDMSIKMWNNYFNGTGLGSDYGTVLEYYSLSGHVDSQVYFDAGGGSWYRSASYASGWQGWQRYITDANISSYAVPPSRTLTINGTAYDLSADRSWTVSAGAADFNTLTNKLGGTGAYQTSGDFRAPIFFDSDDTAYYLNPSSISNLNALNTFGVLSATTSAPSTYDGSSARWVTTQSGNGNFIPYSFESDLGDHSWGIITRFRINQSSPSDRPSIQFSNAVTDTRWNIGYCYTDDDFRVTQNMGYRNDNITTDSWGTERLKINTAGDLYSNGLYQSNASLRAPIFYDSNDTIYYLDPNNTTTSLNIAGKVQVNYGGAGSSTLIQATGSYGTMSLNTYYGVMHTSGELYIGNPAGGATNLYGAQANFNLYSDRNNSAYYVDPASTSVLSAIDTGTAGTYNTFRTWTLLTGSHGFYSSVNNAHIQPNDASYGSWKILGSRNGWGGIEVAYGLNGNVSFMTNSTSAASGIHNNSYGWQIRFDSGALYAGRGTYGGSDSRVLQEDTWINSKYFSSGGEVYAPIFYDANDSAFYFDGSATGDSIRVAGDIVAYYSDERLKDRKGNIENALEKVLSLNGFYYEPNETAQALGYKKKLEVGVSAQEVQAILPEIIKDAPIGGDYKTLDYGRLTPLLIEAIKEQQTQIDELKELVNKLINK